MDDNKFVVVTSMVSGRIGLVVPHLRVNKVFPKKGTKLSIEKDLLREAIYEPGVEYMFKKGMLYIDDMPFKIELGLEEEGTEEPTLVVKLEEKYLNRIAKLMPIKEMKETVEKMNDVQRQELIDFVVKQKDMSFDRLEGLRKVTGVDLVKVIELNREEE